LYSCYSIVCHLPASRSATAPHCLKQCLTLLVTFSRLLQNRGRVQGPTNITLLFRFRHKQQIRLILIVLKLLTAVLLSVYSRPVQLIPSTSAQQLGTDQSWLLLVRGSHHGEQQQSPGCCRRSKTLTVCYYILCSPLTLSPLFLFPQALFLLLGFISGSL